MMGVKRYLMLVEETPEYGRSHPSAHWTKPNFWECPSGGLHTASLAAAPPSCVLNCGEAEDR